MAKKIFSVMLLAAIIFFCGQNKAAAYDVYVGTSNTTGRDCYILTESIYWENYYECSATLKMVNPSTGNVKFLNYEFMVMQHWIDFKNSQGYSGTVNSSVPIENAMWNFILDYSTKNKIRK